MAQRQERGYLARLFAISKGALRSHCAEELGQPLARNPYAGQFAESLFVQGSPVKLPAGWELQYEQDVFGRDGYLPS